MPTHEQRDTRRKPMLAAGLVSGADGRFHADCTIRDLSGKGARIGFARPAALPAKLFFINVRERSVHEAIIAWSTDLESGLSFRKSWSLSQITDPALGFLKRLWMARATR